MKAYKQLTLKNQNSKKINFKWNQILTQYPTLAFTPSFNGEEPIHLAAQKGNQRIVQILLKFGAKMTDPTPKGLTATDLLKGSLDEKKTEIKEDSVVNLQTIINLFVEEISLYATKDPKRIAAIERIIVLGKSLAEESIENASDILLGCIIATRDDAQEMHGAQLFQKKALSSYASLVDSVLKKLQINSAKRKACLDQFTWYEGYQMNPSLS